MLNKKPTIYLVEFAGSSDQELQKALENDGCHVDSCQFMPGPADHSPSQPPDLILLNQPGDKSGVFASCRNFRDAHPLCAICLIHHDLSEWEESVALELGADAVLSNQVELRRILAQVRALLRRQKRDRKPRIQLQDATRMVTVDGRSISLTNSEYELLSVLARESGKVVSRDTISQNLRGLAYDDRNRIIDLRIARIRQKLGDDARAPQFIRTVRGEGYLLME